MALHKLHPSLQNFVKDKWRAGLTPIQELAFDPVFEGKHCVIEAPTSGGKTEAVLFPLLTRISASKKNGYRVLYIAPLKALLNDLALRVEDYSNKCFLEAFKWHGDVSQGEKLEQTLSPSDILLTTPESVEAILLRKANWPILFQHLETVVIDEAHYFALTERGSHLVALLERLSVGIRRRPQRIGVTATIGNPSELLKWLVGKGESGELIKVESKTKKEKDFKAYYFENSSLQNFLYSLLPAKKTIVFERSRTWTEDTAGRINERNLRNKHALPVNVATHHSSISKLWREKAERSIKQTAESSLDAIISTSTLELGIDIGELDQVVQVGGLNSSGSFLQRVGRTGRREGRPQFFRGLCEDLDELVLLTGCMSLGIKGLSEEVLFPKKAFHILAHQTICYCLQTHGATRDQIWTALSRAYCFSAIRLNEFEVLLEFMIEQEYLRRDSENVILTGDRTEKEFFAMNYRRLFAIFDTGKMYNVVDGKKIVGTLDATFAGSQQLPFVFVLGGQEWNALKLDHKLQQVLVEKNETGVAPKWKGIGYFDVPFELAQEVGELIMSKEQIKFLDVSAHDEFEKQRNNLFDLNWEREKWVIEQSDESNSIYLWTFAGDKINRALGNIFSSKLPVNDSHNYMMIEISPKKNCRINQSDVDMLIKECKLMSKDELLGAIVKGVKRVWFSKFSECLPETLAIKTICERGYDIDGLSREITQTAVVG